MRTLNSRAIAAQILSAVLADGNSLTKALSITLPDNADRGFIQELCYGVLRWYWQLNFITTLLVSKPLKEKDTDIHALLLIGLYQLIHLKTPSHAALNETVAAANELKKSWATKFINGVLRQFLREQTAILSKTNAGFTSRYAHPKWLLKLLQEAWPAQWEQIVTANNLRAPLTLRVNRLKTDRGTYLQLLTQQTIAATAIAQTAQGIELVTPQDVTQLPKFAQGFVSVQDAAAQFAASLLDLAPGQRVLDACAAPGGKTAHILETEPEPGELVALEIDAMRCQKIQENLMRLQFLPENKAIKILCADAAQPISWWDGKPFDRILLDAPCSATGVIRRHPDIKFLRRATDIQDLAATQLQLLQTLWSVLKPSGLLVYATCSVLPQENFQVLAKFLATHADAKEKIITADWGIPVAIGRQILPGENNMDGFYYGCLEKAS